MTTWTRQTPNLYTNGTTEITKTTVHFGGPNGGNTTTLWHIHINGTKWDTRKTLTGAKLRVDQLPAVIAGDHCWMPNCGDPVTGTSPRECISLPGDGEIPTCDAHHRQFTGIPRDLTGRGCYVPGCTNNATGLTYRKMIRPGVSGAPARSGVVAICDTCHHRYTGQVR